MKQKISVFRSDVQIAIYLRRQKGGRAIQNIFQKVEFPELYHVIGNFGSLRIVITRLTVFAEGERTFDGSFYGNGEFIFHRQVQRFSEVDLHGFANDVPFYHIVGDLCIYAVAIIIGYFFTVNELRDIDVPRVKIQKVQPQGALFRGLNIYGQTGVYIVCSVTRFDSGNLVFSKATRFAFDDKVTDLLISVVIFYTLLYHVGWRTDSRNKPDGYQNDSYQ